MAHRDVTRIIPTTPTSPDSTATMCPTLRRGADVDVSAVPFFGITPTYASAEVDVRLGIPEELGTRATRCISGVGSECRMNTGLIPISWTHYGC